MYKIHKIEKDKKSLTEIVKGCVKGDNRCRKELYEMHAPYMLNLCNRYSSNQEEAKDIFQEAFYLVYKNIDQLKNPEALHGWVKRIFVNTALQSKKKAQKLFVVEDSTVFAKVTEDFSPLSRLSEKEIIDHIQRLPDGCRKVFNLYAIEGFSHKEIAEVCGISVGTSKSQLHDARKILKAAILRSESFIQKSV